MSENAKKTLKELVDLADKLPKDKQNYLVGYMDAVNDLAREEKEAEKDA